MGNLNIIDRDYSIEDTAFIDEPLLDETQLPGIESHDKSDIPFVKLLAAGAVIISSHHGEDASVKNIIVSQEEDNIEICIDNYTNSIEAKMEEYLAELDCFNALPKYSKQDLYKRIISFKTLNNSWDGYGAYPLEAESATNALLLLDSIGENVFGNVDEVYPNNNGTITFTWENESEEVVNIEVGNKTMSYFVDLKGMETSFINNVEIDDEEANKISEYIQLL
jgi:hypothetical protein